MTDVNRYLTDLVDKLRLNKAEKDKIEAEFDKLDSKLWGHFRRKLKDVQIFGSYDRGTMLSTAIHKEPDIDVLIIFKEKQFKPQTYLTQLQQFAESGYSRSEIFQSSPAISIERNLVRFELVPAYFDDPLKIPAPKIAAPDWISTNPVEFKSSLAAKNGNNSELITPLVSCQVSFVG
jgi:tRNA nucleotidyltransferase (CCA-adding enzyme)